ncbi:MAG: flavodoxin family protein [Planctomycetaceae bacterium]|jgi:multimeric flavodoxin WrbA|nr:flavodoxin family protein [Planctomycetaceae bacterium]
MKVIAINGSPKNNGNTAQALKVLLGEVEKKGIETELVTIGGQAIHGCIGCGRCRDAQNGTCVAFPNDAVNELMPKMIAADAIVLGSPTYFAGINGTMKSFLDRVFYVSAGNGGLFRLKYGSAIVVLRRGGGTAAFDELNKFFQFSEMTVASGCYWSAIHGRTPGELHQDLEGLRILRVQGRNLAYLLQLAEYGKGHVPIPEKEEPIATNFIR